MREHTESTNRQYGLVEKASSLGWDASNVLVIDGDLGLSGRSSSLRPGFKELVSRVCVDEVGAIFGLEVCGAVVLVEEACAVTKLPTRYRPNPAQGRGPNLQGPPTVLLALPHSVPTRVSQGRKELVLQARLYGERRPSNASGS